MSETIVLELPDRLAHSTREIATRTQRRLEDLLVDWIDRTMSDLPVEALPDSQVLALCDSQLTNAQQEQLSRLLAHQREGWLSGDDRRRLDELMQVYRRGLVRKAQAIHVAVQRGLRPPLSLDR
ncbi:MAG: hypothetical protein IPO15_15715 [Anaerolineae bacterium]|uniref:hypothetical protein n=1 Tax=Candidatus Amarolinea dominans TaxID=3140696 RepID=UPI0031375579|nr:hypothetical protein [Anaerolineae bacterium]